MIVSVSFQTWSEEWRNLSDEDYLDLRREVPSLPEDRSRAYGSHLLDEAGLRAVARRNLQVTLEPAVEHTMLVKLQDRIRALELSQASQAEMAQQGAMVQIHIPDISLWYVSEVMVLDDCCTDNLQTYLNDGWHILAVCPPNAQRRPDYVLGRRKLRD